MKKIKLHLGCGTKKLKGFINIDIRKAVKPDVVDDISQLESFDINSVDLIYASHVLEHFSRHKYMAVLRRWYEVLKWGGTIRLSVPDFEKIVYYYTEYNNLTQLIGLLYGGQTYKQNYHMMIWNFSTMAHDLETIGFKNVRTYDWQYTEHSHIDDYSQAYLPHMDKRMA